MNAIELYLKDNKPAGVFYCEKCRLVYPSKERAESCCKPNLCKCGKECPTYWTICDSCRKESEIEKEKARFEAAEKVATHDGWIFCDGLGYAEGYFESVDELLDYCSSEECEIPKYAWCCNPDNFVNVSIDEIIDRISDNGYEGFDSDTLRGQEELDVALQKFNAANSKVVSWSPNYKKAILI